MIVLKCLVVVVALATLVVLAALARRQWKNAGRIDGGTAHSRYKRRPWWRP